MMAISEQRCEHGHMRSDVPCRSCEALESAELRAKALRLDKPFLDVAVAPIVVAPVPVPPVPRAPVPAVPRRATDVTEALRCVAESYMISADHLLRKDRHRNIAEGRQVAAWLLRSVSRLSYPEIGRALGNRDHTTIMSSMKKIELRRAAEPEFLAFTDALRLAVEARIGTVQQ